MRSIALILVIAIVLLGGWVSRAMDQRTHRHSLSGENEQSRKKMVDRQIRGRGIKDKAVLDAMSAVPRHLFVPEIYRALAYTDGPLPIGEGQTISQPYIVAFMTEALDLESGNRVLEVGTGSGYQAAVLAEIVKEVYSIEIIPELGHRARERLLELGYQNIETRIGDGYMGWPEKAPFDAIMVTAAADKIPQPLLDQLKEGGRLCIPVGRVDRVQSLLRITKTQKGIRKETLLPVRFVPLVHPKK